MEQSVVLVKPDGVQRGLIGEIIARFERQLWFKETEINSYRPGGRVTDDREVVFR